MPTVREVSVAPDEEVNATFSIDKSRKEESVLVLSVEKGVLFWNEIVAGDELVLVGGIPANSFASVVSTRIGSPACGAACSPVCC